MSPTAAREAYDAWHERFPVDAEADAPWHRLVRERLDRGRDLIGRRVLEIGCGRGGFALWLAGAAGGAARIIAADFSPAAVRRGWSFAREHGASRVEWMVGDIHRLPFGPGSVDTVISCETVEHLSDPAGALAELARVLRPGGRLFLTTPNYLNTMGLFRVWHRLTGRPYTEEGQPINRVTMWPRTLGWVRRAGLRITAADGSGHYLPIPGRPPVRLRALDGFRPLTRWIAHHSLVVAIKP